MTRMGKGLVEARSIFDWEGAAPALDAVRSARIPVLVVTGGWNPAGEKVADAVVERIEGEHVVIDAEHHFPHLADERFNDRLHDFLVGAEA
jgi:pimeloyl-ACP methyl ester carboxylesterase